MTPIRVAEIAGTATIAFATATAAAVEADVSGWIQLLMPMGVAALVGYFSARVTTEARLSSLTSEIAGLRSLIESQGNEFRRYYRLKGPDEP